MRKKGSLSPQKQVPNCVGAGALTPEPSMTIVITMTIMITQRAQGVQPLHTRSCALAYIFFPEPWPNSHALGSSLHIVIISMIHAC